MIAVAGTAFRTDPKWRVLGSRPLISGTNRPRCLRCRASNLSMPSINKDNRSHRNVRRMPLPGCSGNAPTPRGRLAGGDSARLVLSGKHIRGKESCAGGRSRMGSSVSSHSSATSVHHLALDLFVFDQAARNVTLRVYQKDDDSSPEYHQYTLGADERSNSGLVA